MIAKCGSFNCQAQVIGEVMAWENEKLKTVIAIEFTCFYCSLESKDQNKPYL